MYKKASSLALLILLCACSPKQDDNGHGFPKALPKKDMTAIRADLAFTCVHEADHLPPLDPQADKLFLYGRYLQKKSGDVNYNDVARYYRIAAAYGHYKANHNLQLLVSEGQATSALPQDETIALAEALIKEGVPGGYFDMGHYLEIGYGVKQDLNSALRYFKKAADLGSPEAQSYIAELLIPHDKAPNIAIQMWTCASEQGDGHASNMLGNEFSVIKRYSDAVTAFQNGAEAGDTQSALFMQQGFDGPALDDRLSYLALGTDPERVRRYRKIWEFLHQNDGLNPKVPDIDKIVPLPPAKLPAWDGTFEWQKKREAAVPPEKPSEQLIEDMAKAKHLDPATGLPLQPATS